MENSSISPAILTALGKRRNVNICHLLDYWQENDNELDNAQINIGKFKQVEGGLAIRILQEVESQAQELKGDQTYWNEVTDPESRMKA